MSLSVIIVNYNTGLLLERCLESVRRFVGDETVDVVVVDNASTDESLETLARFPEVRLIANRENVGFARAVNQGIAASDGPYLLLLNPDTTVVSPVFRRLVEFAESRIDAGIVGPRLLNPDGTLQPSAYRFPTLFQAVGAILALRRLVPVRLLRRLVGSWLGRHFGQLDPHACPRPVDYVTGACMLIRRDVVGQIGGFDTRFFLYFEDKDFCLRARQAGWQVYFAPCADVVHAIGGSSGHRPRIAVVERFRSMRQFYDKHATWPCRLALRGILLLGGLWRLAGAGLAGQGEATRAWITVLGLALEPSRSE